MLPEASFGVSTKKNPSSPRLRRTLREITSALLLLLFICSQKSTLCEAPMDYKNVYFIILAGGSGTRLWPLSRKNKPKQFLSVGTEKTLIDQAIERVSSLVPKENIWISTTKEQEENIIAHVGEKIGQIIVEPGLRNTGPAILLACLELQKQNKKASVIFLPADPFISDKDSFVGYVKQAIDFTLSYDHITLLGLTPTYPATGYGYIEFDRLFEKPKHGTFEPFPVIQFHEKPSLETAKAYIKKNNMLWNIGMFCGKVSVFVDEFKKVAPEIYEGVTAYVNGQGGYNNVKSDSIDYAVMEKSDNIFVLPVDFPWCDVGNIEVFLTIQKDAMKLKNNTISVNAKNNLVDVKNKLVALIGVDDLCIVETDDVILVTKRDEAKKVKLVVNQLKKSEKTNYL